MDNLIRTMLNFIGEIGLSYQLEKIEEDTFLPGLKIRNGSLIVDLDKLLYPGDILHEAGHLACIPPDIRMTVNGNVADKNESIDQGAEMMTIAWSYAAALHLKIAPGVVFHEHGYKGGSDSLVENFSEGRYIGVPLLQWHGMSYEPGQAEKLGKQAFPAMTKWTCTKNMFTNSKI